MKNLLEEIPSLDLSQFTGGNKEEKALFVQKLGAAYEEIGFVAIKNHGLSDQLVGDLYESVKAFFTLPEVAKKVCEVEGLAGQRGYTSKGKEHAKGRKTGDLKEFYHIGQPKEIGDQLTESYPDNIWPTELPEFKTFGEQAFKILEQTGTTMLKAIALYLGLDECYFDEKVVKGNSILRQIHYFPIENPNEVPDDAVRAAEHGDINLITLLMGASAEGLQVQRRDGQWISITALPDQIIVNVGDMLDRLTNHKLKSTIHRVVNPSKEKMNTSRYSIPFFMHPRAEMDLSCLESCISVDTPKIYEDITAGDFLMQRLKEIGLIK